MHNWFCYEHWRGQVYPVLHHHIRPADDDPRVVRGTIIEVPKSMTLREAKKHFDMVKGGGSFVRT